MQLLKLHQNKIREGVMNLEDFLKGLYKVAWFHKD